MEPKMDQTKAIVFEKYGGPLLVGTLNLRPLEPKQILIKVYSASLNPFDYKRRDGETKNMIKDEFPAGICFDVAGTIEQVGAEVTEFSVGDRVAASSLQSGTLAEYCVVDSSVSTKLPVNVSYNDAAALPMAGMTAYQGLLRCGLKEGESVFISGGAGGVGVFAVQLAKKFFKAGRVVTSCSTAKVDFCKSLGADEALDYTKGDVYKRAAEKGAFDTVFDTIGDASQMGRSLIKPGRFLVSVAALPEPGAFDRAGISIPFWLRGVLYLLSTKARWGASPGIYNYLVLKSNAEDLAILVKLQAEGTLKVELDSVFEGLEKSTDAFARIETGRAKGKVVVVVRSS